MRLLDCFSPLLAYGAALGPRLASSQPPLAAVRRDIEALLDRSQRLAEKAGVDQDRYEAGRFAVSAWLDELILTSPWREKDEWEKQQLQLVRYRTTNAGEEFYQRLEAMMGGTAESELMAVYGACLSLGFSGRYYPIREKITLEDTTREVLQDATVGIDNPLGPNEGVYFPGAYHGEGETPKKPVRWGLIPFWFLVVGLAAGAMAGVFFGLNHYLDQIVELYFKAGT